MVKLFAAVSLIVLVSILPLAAAEIPDYDIRDDHERSDVIERHRERAGRERNERIREKKEKMRGAAERVRGEVPGLAVAFSAHTGGPELVTIERGRQRLTGRSREPREQVVRGYLQRNADLFGLSAREVAQLKKVADYANPAGNLAWVDLEQELNGLPFFAGNIRFAITTEGELVHATGNLVPAIDDAPQDRQPAVTAAAAAAIAAESIGAAFTPVLVGQDGTTFVFARGPFTQDIRVRLEYFPLDAGIVTLAWSMILKQDDAAFYTYVSAEGGEVLWRRNILFTQTQPATYVVYGSDSPAPLSPTNATPGAAIQPPLVPRTSFTVISEHAFNSLGWMADGTSITTGNNADAGLDLTPPDGIDEGTRATGTAFRIFDYAYNPSPGNPAPGDEPSLANFRFGEVVNLFFWANRYHDRLYELGFTEGARNFQQDNFGRGGLGGDAVIVEGQGFEITNNANFVPEPDGFPGKAQMFLFTAPVPPRSGGLDQEVFIHELTHGTSTRLHGNIAGLGPSGMAGGMGEGWSDFYARALLSGPEEDVSGVYPVGAYAAAARLSPDTSSYYGIRRFPYAIFSSLGPNGRPHNPLTFADVDAVSVDLSDGAYPRSPAGGLNPFEVHAMGEVWCSLLLEVRARLIQRLGWAAGNQLALQLVTDGMKLDPLNPNFLQGRSSILTANFASANASAATEVDIWRGFAARGMGFSARINNAATGSVGEAFDVPNIAVSNVTILSDNCDGNGVPDPGETLVLSMTLANPYQLNDINDAVVTVGGSSTSLGPLAPGQSVTRTFPFSIPATAGCGLRYDVPIAIASSFGAVTRTHTLQLGTPTLPTGAATYSSGAVAMPIADGQTVEVPIVVTGSGPIGAARVSVRLNHTALSDLALSLVAPDGTIVPLAVRRGLLGDNFGIGANDCNGAATLFSDTAATAISAGVAPFNGTFRPESPLSALFRREMQGVWKLRVSDLGPGNSGVVGCVKLELESMLAFCCGVAGTPMIFAPPATLAGECATNGAVDPGEIVTMNFPLVNFGSGLTTDLVATLLPTGGVTPISGPQSYGVLSPIGPPVVRAFEFAVSSSIACGSNIVATLALSDNGNDLGTVSFSIPTGTPVTNTFTFSNAAPIQIPAAGGGASTGAPAAPYPSTITVSGVPGPMSTATLTIHGFSHTAPLDVDLLLVGPGGQKFLVLSDFGGFTDVVNATITFADAGAFLPSTLVSGTFRAGNSGAGDVFPAPAPPAPYQSPGPVGQATFTTVFAGSNPNGTWSLYAVDDAAGVDAGAIAGGWSLAIRTTTRVCATVGPPAIAGAAANPPLLWPPSHDMRDVVVSYTADSCAECSLSVTSSEPIDGLGDGDTAPDYEVVDAHHVRLRAERGGAETSRVYTIAITCANGAGTTVQTVPVVVSHDGRGGN